MAEKSWAGRFCQKTDRSVEDFTASIDSDKRLYPYDIEGSIAHCRTLAKANIISQGQADALIEGLGKIKQELDLEAFEFDNALEDIHMHIEARLVQRIGEVAHKLHTARSRNDQVALDLRLYLRDEVSHIVGRLLILEQVLVKMARDNLATIMPGYTHLQRAQPVLLSHHLMAYYEMFKRDVDRFRDGMKRINVMPLGSAAVAGTTYPVDREYTARLLEFP
ncbi:MAG: argininosuccinate lyase, partial [Desulfobacterales bacterium]